MHTACGLFFVAHLTFALAGANVLNMTNTNTTSKIPVDLRAAYAWTDAAGELGILASLFGDELAAYAADSAENATEHDCDDVYASDIVLLAEWLRRAEVSR